MCVYLSFLVSQLFFDSFQSIVWQLIVDFYFFYKNISFDENQNCIKDADIAGCLKKQSGKSQNNNKLTVDNWVENVRKIIDGLKNLAFESQRLLLI